MWCPKIRDLGILASLDPVAIDRASFDLIVKENTEGSREWIGNSDSLLGENTIKVAEELGIGTQEYNLINVDTYDDGEEEENQSDNDEDKSDNNTDNNNDDSSTKLLLLIMIPSVVILLVVTGLIGFLIYKKKSQNQITNGSLGVSMTGKTE